MAEAKRQRIDLREACLDEALAIIREGGIENLSLREVARRLGSPTRRRIGITRAGTTCSPCSSTGSFREFDAHLGQAGETEDARADLAAMGRLYLDYALQNPLEYRLMFGAPLPSPEDHPEMLECGCAAFDRLRAAIARILGRGRGGQGGDARGDVRLVDDPRPRLDPRHRRDGRARHRAGAPGAGGAARSRADRPGPAANPRLHSGKRSKTKGSVTCRNMWQATVGCGSMLGLLRLGQ
jgi:hypothetical protein